MDKSLISIAPMMDWTDRYQRYFMRLITKHSLLYTEMIHANAIVRGDRKKLLHFDASEHPLALQLGGSDPLVLAEAAKIAEEWGYDEVNLNVGCPSERVQSGSFGACLMAEPKLVGQSIAAMKNAVKIPVTVKCRIGIDKADSYDFFKNFIQIVQAESGCNIFIVHARSAWLKGLSPKENRDIPPLHYDYVYRLKQEFPDLTISINGGIKTHTEITEHLQHVDGVMLGREAYHNPYFLATVDRDYYGDNHAIPTRAEILQSYVPFLEQHVAEGVPLKHMTRHILGLYQGQSGAREWRRKLTENTDVEESLPFLCK